MTIESGAPASSRNYWIIILVVVVGLAVWFLRDGLYGYAEKNREEAERHLTGRTAGPLNLGKTPTQADAKQIEAAPPSSPAELHKRFGSPAVSEREPDGTQVEQYPSIYGLLTVRSRDGRVVGSQWQNWAKTEDSIRQQLYLAALLAVLALYPVYRLYNTLTRKVVLDDAGLTYEGDHIPIESMRDLRNYDPKGWVDLYYTRDGQETRLRLDNQRVDKFDEIVAAIAERKGLPNPVRPQPSTA